MVPCLLADFPSMYQSVLPLLRLPSAQLLLLWCASIASFCYLLHQWSSSRHFLLRFSLGILAGIAMVFTCHLSYCRRQRIRKMKEAYVQDMVGLSKDDLSRLLPGTPASADAPMKKLDKFEWLNVELTKSWPFLNEATSDIVRENLQSVLDEYKMGALVEIKVPDLSFGVASPRFTGVRMLEMKEDEACLEVDFHWEAERELIIVKVKTIGPDFKIKVHNTCVSGTLKLVLKPLADIIPCFGAVLVSMSAIPDVHFDLKIAAGNVSALPGVEKMINTSIRAALEDSLVWPSRIVCPVLPGDYSYLTLKTVGVLDVTLVKAKEVMNTDILGKSDCFVLLYVRKKPQRIKRSSTKKNSLHPIWNEGFKIEVEDPECQQLNVQLMDEESFANAEFIGRATVPIHNLVPHEPKEIWLDMVDNPDLQNRKVRGHVQIVVVYEPVESS